MSPTVVIDHDGDVEIVSLNIPHKRNALDLPARVDLLDALRHAESSARAIVLTGAGGFFCAGGDIHAMSSDPVGARTRLDVLSALAHQIVHSTVPVIAAIEGGAHGMGLSLACAATYVVSAENATFEASFAKIGLVPDTGLSWTLPRRVGPATARRMMLTLLSLQGRTALDAGLVDEVVDDGQALPRAIEVAQEIALLPAPTVAGLTHLFAEHASSIDLATVAEARLQTELLATPESIQLRERFVHRRARR